MDILGKTGYIDPNGGSVQGLGTILKSSKANFKYMFCQNGKDGNYFFDSLNGKEKVEIVSGHRLIQLQDEVRMLKLLKEFNKVLAKSELSIQQKMKVVHKAMFDLL